MKNVARWILVIPAAWLGWSIGTAVFGGLMKFLQSNCQGQDPSNTVLAMGCHGMLEPSIMFFGTMLMSVLSISFAATVAPRYRSIVAWSMLALMASYIFYFTYQLDFDLGYLTAFSPYILGALGGGLVSAYCVQRLEIRQRVARQCTEFQ